MDLIDLMNIMHPKTQYSLFDKENTFIGHGMSGEGIMHDYIYCGVLYARAEGTDEVFVWLDVSI